MRRIFATVLSILQGVVMVEAEAANCTLRPEMLLGSWVQANRSSSFEQMEFASQGGMNSFSSWLHDRPEISGAAWTLEDCVLRINKPDDRSLSFVFAASMKSGSRLELREIGQPVAKYKRIKE